MWILHIWLVCNNVTKSWQKHDVLKFSRVWSISRLPSASQALFSYKNVTFRPFFLHLPPIPHPCRPCRQQLQRQKQLNHQLSQQLNQQLKQQQHQQLNQQLNQLLNQQINQQSRLTKSFLKIYRSDIRDIIVHTSLEVSICMHTWLI